MIRISTYREQISGVGRPFARAFAMANSRPSFLTRFLFMLGAITFTAIGVIVLVPILLIGLLFAALLVGGVALRMWLTRARRPNGVLDGRHNVRVRVPSETGG